MKKLSLLVCLVGLFVAQGKAQSCTDTISDTANVLATTADLQKTASALTDQGADVHFITTSAASSTLDQQVQALEDNCLTWQSPNHSVKANILVFMVAPKERKMAIYFGSGYKAALNGQTDRIKRDFMGPYFKTGDWAGGLVMGGDQVLGRIKAVTDESNKPVTYSTTTTNNTAPTDYHGLWVFFWIIAAVVVAIFLVGIILVYRKKKGEIQESQQKAIAARARVVSLLTSVKDNLAAYTGPNSKAANSKYNVAEKLFSDLASTFSGDPTSEHMEQAFYDGLHDAYDHIEGILESTQRLIDGSDEYEDSMPDEHEPPMASVPITAPSTQPTRTAEKETVVVHDNSGDFATGVLVGDLLGSRPEREPEYREPERVREPEPEEEPVRSSSHDDDLGGSSSSWSDSGSSFGGGSSDFGGGGDSGGGFGGGSSDF